MMETEIQCPVDFVLINENKVRLVAFFVLILTTVFLLTDLWIIIAFLVIDFFMRVNNWGKFSLLAILSDAIIKQLNIKNKPTDRAPKRFAAGMGLVFTTGLLVLTLLHLTLASAIVGLVLVFFAFLESILGFCAGCHVYSILGKISNSIKNK